MSYKVGLIKPLLFPSCYPDESPIGYLIRIAELNNYGSFKWFIGEHHSKVSSVIHDFYYKILAKYDWTGFRENNNYKQYRELSQNYFVARGHRFCPLCLKDKPYFKMCWQLRVSVVCLKHKIWLHDFCFKCETQNSFSNSKITSCKCGEPYTTLEVSEASEEVIRLQKYSLGIPIEHDLDKSNFLSFAERLDLVMFFTKWFGFRNEAVNLRDMDRARTNISNAAEALFSGKSGFTNFLKRVNESIYENANAPGIFLTKFRCEFYEKFKQDSLEPIRISIEEYINRNWHKPLSRRNINFHAETITQHPWIPFQSACREFDIHKSVLKNAIENHLIRWEKDHKQKGL
ncbi:MAG: TniQ family protein [Cellvibrio sp.]|nr:TniQ family protein [Cellvibrio sp.]